MARVGQYGFESHDALLEGQGNYSGTYTFATDRVRTGSYSWKIASGSTAELKLTPSISVSHYGRVYLNLSASPSTARTIVWDPSVGANYGLRLNTDRTISTLSNGSVTATTSSAVAINGWTLLEWYQNYDATDASVKIAGVEEISGADVGVAVLSSIGVNGGSLGADLWVDDAALNDTAGSYNNSWVGAGAVVQLVPGSDTATINWSTTGGAHYTEVDDAAGTLDTTTYVSTVSKTDQLEDRWNLTDTPGSVASGDTINAIFFGVRGGGDATTTRQGLLKIIDGVGNDLSTIIDWNINGWKTVEGNQGDLPGSVYRLERTILFGAALTKSYVDGLIACVNDYNTNTRLIRVTAVWATVDYTPAATPKSFLPLLPSMRPRVVTRRKVI
jgi:hypothetical protein